MQLTPTATSRRMVAERERVRDRLAGRRGRRRPGTRSCSQAGTPHLVEQPDQDRAPRGSSGSSRRRAGRRRPRRGPRSAGDGSRRGRPGPGRSRRGTRSRRRASPRTARPSRRRAADGRPAPDSRRRGGRGPGARARRSCAISASAAARSSPAAAKPVDRRLVAGRRRDLRPGPEVGEMDGLDRVRVGQRAGAPTRADRTGRGRAPRARSRARRRGRRPRTGSSSRPSAASGPGLELDDVPLRVRRVDPGDPPAVLGLHRDDLAEPGATGGDDGIDGGRARPAPGTRRGPSPVGRPGRPGARRARRTGRSRASDRCRRAPAGAGGRPSDGHRAGRSRRPGRRCGCRAPAGRTRSRRRRCRTPPVAASRAPVTFTCPNRASMVLIRSSPSFSSGGRSPPAPA